MNFCKNIRIKSEDGLKIDQSQHCIDEIVF